MTGLGKHEWDSLRMTGIDNIPYLTVPTDVRARPPVRRGEHAPEDLFGWCEGGGGRQVTDWDGFNSLGSTIDLPGVIIHLH